MEVATTKEGLPTAAKFMVKSWRLYALLRSRKPNLKRTRLIRPSFIEKGKAESYRLSLDVR